MLAPGLAASYLLTLCRGLIAVGLLLSFARCAPDFTFPDDEREEVQCVTGLAECDGITGEAQRCETNILTNALHCGGCGNVCSLANAEASCVGGRCQPIACHAGFADCDGRSGNGCEANLDQEIAHCGSCGKRCSNINGTPTCDEGTCEIECSGQWRDCNRRVNDGCEVTTARDVQNCGGCGKSCEPEAGEVAFCADGTCGSTACKAGFGDCDGDGVCTEDLANDENNCGYCGHWCVVENGKAECVDGECRIKECDAGYANCDSSADDGGYSTGCEVDTDISLSNCGACGNECSVEQGVPRCVDGECRIGSCSTGYADCDGIQDSCEIDTRTDPTNCGACSDEGGANCTTAFDRAVGACVNGGCVFLECQAGWKDCDSNKVCETQITSDAKNCGDCGVACKTNQTTTKNSCVDGMCRPECATGYEDCNGVSADGCESDVRNDPNHCGSCEPCSTQGTKDVDCERGQCVLTCADGFEDCDGNPSNGCETEIAADDDNCGACESKCELTGAEDNTCEGGKCVPICETERGDCDGNPKNGCESSVFGDDENCGACDRACLSGEGTHATGNHCEGMACVPTCEPGFAACSNPELGCVTSLDTPEHCGACSNACSGVTSNCVERRCQSRITVLRESQGSAAAPNLDFSMPDLVPGENRLLFLAVTGRSASPNSFEQGSPETVRVGGMVLAPFEQLDGGQGPSSAAGQNHHFFYYLLEKDFGAVNWGTGATISIVAQSNQGARSLAANAVLFSGVDQEAPVGLTQAKRAEIRCETAQPRDTLSLARGGSVIYSLIGAQHTGTEFGVVPPLSRLLLASFPREMVGNREVGIQGGIAGLDDLLPSGPTTIGWTFNTCNNWTMLSVVLQPVQRQ